MMEWKNIFRGMLIGASDLVPGVSGGTIGVILGIYERLIVAISGFFSREWRKHLGFLIPLGVGAVLAIFLLSHVMKWLLEYYPQPTFFFFLGLIGGIVPFLFKKINYKSTFGIKHYVVLLISAIAIATTAFIKEDKEAVIIEALNTTTALYLFFSGWLASMAMLLPGISGSLVMLLLGAYETVINALATLNVGIIVVVGAGIVVGFIISSKVIRYLLATMPVFTYAIIIGMVLGSVIVIFPGIESNVMLLVVSILTFIVGFYSASYVGRHEQ